MKVEWSPRAVTTASRFLDDADGMRAVVAALDALTANPYPAESFRWGEMFRLRVSKYRIMYVVEGDLITIERVDRVGGGRPRP
jgi:mRNA-degrading endonuclease RelE of RelBE toxin-antitoxin system